MTLMSWLYNLIAPSRENADRHSEALRVTDEAAGAARDLRRTIEPYSKLKDPFIALWATRYEVQQEDNIHEGDR